MRNFQFRVVAKIVPAVRMTQRSKYANPQAQRYLAYKGEIGYRAKEAGAIVIPRPTPVLLHVAARAVDRKWDASNVLKAVEDALNGICWDDDSQITDAQITVADSTGGEEYLYITVGVD